LTTAPLLGVVAEMAGAVWVVIPVFMAAKVLEDVIGCSEAILEAEEIQEALRGALAERMNVESSPVYSIFVLVPKTRRHHSLPQRPSRTAGELTGVSP
jgi:hypothetical protein